MILRLSFRLLVFFSLLLAAGFPFSTAFAEQKSDVAGENEDIVVTAQLERRKQINKFIKATVRKAGDKQYARYHAPICPTVFGLKKEHGSNIVSRMRAVATAADIKVGKAECKPNMILIILDGPREFIKYLRKNHGDAMGDMYIPARNRLMKGPGPAFTWNFVRSYAVGGAAPAGTEDDNDVPSIRGENSRIRRATAQQITGSIILIEKDAITGLNYRQLADYALMRLAANSREPQKENASHPTILSIFSDNRESDEMHQSVTAWDMALLTALYGTDPETSSSSQRASMGRVFEKELAKYGETTNQEPPNKGLE